MRVVCAIAMLFVDLAVCASVVRNLTLPGFPHEFDVFAPSGGTGAALFGMVFLHGGGGTKEGTEVSLNISLEWIEASSVVVAIPQGQSLPTCRQGPPLCRSYTWTNYVMDSGADDVGFLANLSAYLRDQFMLPRLALAGHSNGGFMASRMWCERPTLFDSYMAFSGPASSWFSPSWTPVSERKACSPTVERPFSAIVSDHDFVLGTSGRLRTPMWRINKALVLLSAGTPGAFVNTRLINDLDTWALMRVPRVCGETPAITPTASSALSDTFSACGGTVNLTVLKGATDDGSCPLLSRGHCIAFLQEQLGESLLQAAANFEAAVSATPRPSSTPRSAAPAPAAPA